MIRLALALLFAAVASTSRAAPPQLKTQGNLVVVEATGEPIRLLGVNIASLDWGNGENLMTSLEVAVGTWKSNIIRLPVKAARWNATNGSQLAYKATVDAFIARASELGVYVILDLHEYTKVEAEDVVFWQDAAVRYANNPAVLYGLLNEPHGIGWEVWQNGDSPVGGMQDLLDTVRATGANNVVLAGGLDWGFDLRGILDGRALIDTASGKGVIYDSHVYPWKSYIQRNVGNVAQQYPVLIGEIGHRGGTYDSAQKVTVMHHERWVPRWLDWINGHSLHMTAWCFHPTSSPKMLEDWSYTPTDYWGSFVKDVLQTHADPDALRVVGGTVIGTTGTRTVPNSGVLTADSGAIAVFDGSYESYFDNPSVAGTWAGLDLAVPRRITQIQYMPRKNNGHLMVGGVFQGSNTANFSSGVVTLHTVTTAPDATYVLDMGTYVTVPITDTGTYRYVRYMGPGNYGGHVGSVLFYTGTNATPALGDDVIVIDNGGAGSTITGSWSDSGGSGYHGTKWVNDGNNGKGAKSIRYTPTITHAGDYEVFVTWYQHTSRATNVPYTITHAGSTSPDTVYIDQREPGLPWKSLGVFTFAAGTSGNLLVSNAGTTNFVSADAAMFVRRSAGGGGQEVDLILDKQDADTGEVFTVGSWTFSTYSPGGYTYVGNGAYHDGNSGKGSKSVLFTPNIPEAGDYEVSVRWMSHSGRSSNVPIVVTHAGGTDIHYVNQKNPSGDWYPLSTYTFAAGAGGDVLIHNGGTQDGHVSVDAVRFHKAGATP